MIWNPITTQAPKTKTILVWHDPEAPCACSEDYLCLFHSHQETWGTRLDPGPYLAIWGGEWDEGDEWLPNWWFKEEDALESPLNPTHWLEIPDRYATREKRDREVHNAAVLACISALGPMGSPLTALLWKDE